MLSAILFIVLGTVIGGIWGFIIGRPKRDKRRQPGIGPVEGTHGAPWPRGPAGIPKSGDGDDTP